MDQELKPPISTPVEPTSPQPAPSPRGFNPVLVLVVIALLVLVGVGGLILGKSLNNLQPSAQPTIAPLPTQIPTPTSDITANWKTYTNKKYNFYLKYPPDWSFYEKNSNIVFGPLSTKNHIGETVPEYVSSYITLDIYTSPQNTDLVPFKKISSDLKPVWKDFKIGEINGKEVKHLGCLSGNCRDVLFQSNELVFNFFEQNNLKELDQILSTFKFTSP